jgi:hypothetical protein
MARNIITIEMCQELAKERGGKCLSVVFEYTKSNLKWQCSKGHIWEANYRNVKHNNSWCPDCAGKRRKTIQDCMSLAKLNDGLFLSKEYVGNKGIYDWQCSEGHIFPMKYNDVQQGHWCPVCAPAKRQDTHRKRFGVDHPMHDPKIALRCAKAAANSFILHHWKTGEELVCQASYEKAVVEHFNENKINFLWQPEAFSLPNGSTYRPDCYLPDQNLWIEIKGYFRKDAQEKWEWFQSVYPNSELWDKKKLISLKIL